MLDHLLSSQQLAVICALSSGVNMTNAAEQAGVHRNTIANWRRNFLPFQRALADAQYDRALYFREKLEDLVDLAIQSLKAILADPKASPSVKLRAVLTIVQTAATPPAPKKQLQLDIEKIVLQRSTPENMTDSQLQSVPKMHKDAQPEPPAVHNEAQPTPEICENPQPPAAHGVSRNAKCPCGSGKKYKHCCLDSIVASALARAA